MTDINITPAEFLKCIPTKLDNGFLKIESKDFIFWLREDLYLNFVNDLVSYIKKDQENMMKLLYACDVVYVKGTNTFTKNRFDSSVMVDSYIKNENPLGHRKENPFHARAKEIEILANSGQGKSFYLLELLAAESFDHKCYFVCDEMEPRFILNRLEQMNADVDHSNITIIDSEKFNKMIPYINEFDESFSVFVDGVFTKIDYDALKRDCLKSLVKTVQKVRSMK